MLLNYSRTWDLAPRVWPLYCLHGWNIFLWNVLLPCVQPSISHLLWLPLTLWVLHPYPRCLSSLQETEFLSFCLIISKPTTGIHVSFQAHLQYTPEVCYLMLSQSIPGPGTERCGPLHNKSNFLQFWGYFWRLTAFLCLYKLTVRIVLLYLPMLPNQSLYI